MIGHGEQGSNPVTEKWPGAQGCLQWLGPTEPRRAVYVPFLFKYFFKII